MRHCGEGPEGNEKGGGEKGVGHGIERMEGAKTSRQVSRMLQKRRRRPCKQRGDIRTALVNENTSSLEQTRRREKESVM